MKLLKKRRSIRITICQLIYLTAVFFAQNNLYICAASCAFSFLFSFIPIIMMVLTILVSILHASPSLINYILSFSNQFKNIFDVQSFINVILSYDTFSLVEFFIAVFIIWMARKSFVSIVKGMDNIFHTEKKSRPILDQAIIFISELAFVIIFAISILVVFTIRQITSQFNLYDINMAFNNMFNFSPNIITVSEYALIFIIILLTYKFTSTTKPSLKLCAFCAAACTVSFFVASFIVNLFMNISNYNIIYGLLSSLMIFLCQTYLFFMLFFIFAQLVYVVQFFDLLLLSELYLLPEYDDTQFNSVLKRILFINPTSLMSEKNVLTFEANKTIFKKNDSSDDSYYVLQGTVVVNRNGAFSYYDKGSFFGEETCILNKVRIGDAFALTSCKLIKIDAKDFLALIEVNHKAAEKALSNVRQYV